jgi:hypothetical protein
MESFVPLNYPKILNLPHKEKNMQYYKKVNSDSQNLLSGHYATSDGHGGRGTQHREEMQTIAREVFKEEREALM